MIIKKHKETFLISKDEETIDMTVFSNRDLAPLQSLIMHLKERGLTFKKISVLLNRSYKTVWLTYNKK